MIVMIIQSKEENNPYNLIFRENYKITIWCLYVFFKDVKVIIKFSSIIYTYILLKFCGKNRIIMSSKEINYIFKW